MHGAIRISTFPRENALGELLPSLGHVRREDRAIVAHSQTSQRRRARIG
jgi:hypothetical protein